MGNYIGTVGIVLHREKLPVGRKFRTLNRRIQDADICASVNVTPLTEVLFADIECMRTKSGIKGRPESGRTSRLLRAGGWFHSTPPNRGRPFFCKELNIGPRLRQRYDPRGAGSHGGRCSKSWPDCGLFRTRNGVP
jgi:hypothetical protein